MIRNLSIITLLIGIAYSFSAFAVRESRPISTDTRIRVMVYSPDDIFKYTGYYGYQASIVLDPEEEVVNISMGDTTAWQIVPNGHRIFIKPIDDDATTNMTMITNKRTYFFELYADEAQDIRDPDMVFTVRFIYPDEEDEDAIRTYSSITSGPDMTSPEKYNFNYSISGYEDIAPIKIFDDGEFTYLQFRNVNSSMPAVFAIEDDLRETMVNSRLDTENNMIIIEQVFKKIALKLDRKVVCIFNESFRPYHNSTNGND